MRPGLYVIWSLIAFGLSLPFLILHSLKEVSCTSSWCLEISVKLRQTLNLNLPVYTFQLLGLQTCVAGFDLFLS